MAHVTLARIKHLLSLLQEHERYPHWCKLNILPKALPHLSRDEKKIKEILTHLSIARVATFYQSTKYKYNAFGFPYFSQMFIILGHYCSQYTLLTWLLVMSGSFNFGHLTFTLCIYWRAPCGVWGFWGGLLYWALFRNISSWAILLFTVLFHISH